MAFCFKPGGPLVGAVRALALMAGLMALAMPGAASAASTAIFPDHAPLLSCPAIIAMGSPAIPDPRMRAGGLAGAMLPGGDGARLDGGRLSV